MRLLRVLQDGARQKLCMSALHKKSTRIKWTALLKPIQGMTACRTQKYLFQIWSKAKN
jgi:hypothetical protein